VPELQRLRAGHAPAVLAFELANRVYFATSVSDRGDEFYDRFTERHSALLAEQEAGIGAFYVLVAEDGSVLGRFNLVFAEGGTAELGYRVSQHVAGRGVATATVRELCGLAAAQYGLRTLKAATSRENAASQKVLARAGFIPVGPADPADLGGKQGTWYQRDLVQPLSSSLPAAAAGPAYWSTYLPMARTVGLPMKFFRLILMPIRSVSLATSTAASREWPPRSKKLSSTPTWSVPRTWANSSHKTRSRALAGAWNALAPAA
jgi:[ribosomal protein S5]-alanine N-acetyltransferase